MAALQTPQDKLDESRAALERKSQLYERLAAGQDNDAAELYNVDFLHKGTLEEEKQLLQHEAADHAQHVSSETPIDTAAGLLSSAGRFLTAPCPSKFASLMRRSWRSAKSPAMQTYIRYQSHRRGPISRSIACTMPTYSLESSSWPAEHAI